MATNSSKQTQADAEAAVADKQADDAQLEHSQGGVTTRSDVLDIGAPMLQGDASEPVGPEDALGAGPKRGTYTLPAGYNPHTTEPVPDAKPGEPNVRIVPQRQYAEEVGEVKGRKGGVNSAKGGA